MFELLPASRDPGLAAGVPVTDLLEHLRRFRVNENISICAQVNTAAGFWFETMRTEADVVAAGGAVTVGNSVYSEIGSVLGCEATVARAMCGVGVVLSRFPMLADAFDRGVVDYARVRTVVNVLDDAGDDTITAIESGVLAAALELTPGPLRGGGVAVVDRGEPGRSRRCPGSGGAGETDGVCAPGWGTGCRGCRRVSPIWKVWKRIGY